MGKMPEPDGLERGGPELEPILKEPSPVAKPHTFGEWLHGHGKVWITALLIAAFGLGAAAYSGAIPYMQSHRGDIYTQQKKAEITQNFKGKTITAVSVNISDPVKLAEAAKNLNLPQLQSEQVLEQVKKGNLRLIQITLWDYLQEDGDSVQVSLGGLSRTLVIQSAPVTVTLPVVTTNTAPALKVSGIADGGGGVTLGVGSGGGGVLFPPFEVGNTLTIPVF